MKKLAVFALLVAALVPALAAQTTAGFTGKWEGTFVRTMPDGSKAAPQPVVFHLTQKGAELTGTAGPGEEQFKVEKGVVKAGTATFDVQSNGPMFQFTLKIVKGRLQGSMVAMRDGAVVGQATVDAARAK